MPAKFREALGDGLVITKSMEPCLDIFPRKDWLEIEGKLRALPMSRGDARKVQRLIFGSATEETITRQGRVTIPQGLRDYGGLQKDVVIVGVSNRLELWSKERWESYIKDAEGSFAEITEQLTEFGI